MGKTIPVENMRDAKEGDTIVAPPQRAIPIPPSKPDKEVEEYGALLDVLVMAERVAHAHPVHDILPDLLDKLRAECKRCRKVME